MFFFYIYRCIDVDIYFWFSFQLCSFGLKIQFFNLMLHDLCLCLNTLRNKGSHFNMLFHGLEAF